jgi:hypothetical protein
MLLAVGAWTSGFATPAFAGQADICYSANAAGDVADRLTASTPLDCPSAGHHTLSQLAQAGWSVASLQSVVVDYSPDPATHTPRSATAWMLVIQKGAP